MLACFISDIHGNEIAFDQCLEWLNYLNPDRIFFLGDAVGYFPGGETVLDKLNSAQQIECQCGNHEKMLLNGPPSEKDHIYQLGLLQKQISSVALSRVKKWPNRREVEIGGKTFLLVHGSPGNELEEYIYPDDNLKSVTNNTYDAILMGHTHYPFVKQIHGKLIANVGSIGLPRDIGQLASMALYDSSTEQCKILRFQINIEMIINLYGSSIHESVHSCIRRKADGFIGEMIL